MEIAPILMLRGGRPRGSLGYLVVPRDLSGTWGGEAGRSCGGLGSVGVVGGDVFDCAVRGVSEKRNRLSGW